VSELDTQTPEVDTPAPDFDVMGIPESYKDTPVSKYKTVGEAMKGYNEVSKLVGAKGVIVPSDKSTPEEWDKFYNSLGRPEKPEEYKFSPIEGLHPELKMSPESDAEFKAIFHKRGLNAKQADGLYKDYLNLVSQLLIKRDEQTLAQKQEAEKKLRSEWLGDFNGNLAKVQGLIAKHGGTAEDFGDLGNRPGVLRVLANIAKKFSEDTFVRGSETPSEAVDAKKKLNDILLNKEHPYWKQGVGHDDAVREVMRLQEICTPNEREVTHS